MINVKLSGMYMTFCVWNSECNFKSGVDGTLSVTFRMMLCGLGVKSLLNKCGVKRRVPLVQTVV